MTQFCFRSRGFLFRHPRISFFKNKIANRRIAIKLGVVYVICFIFLMTVFASVLIRAMFVSSDYDSDENDDPVSSQAVCLKLLLDLH